MFHLVLQRILHKKWMIASLLIGNILLVAIAVSHPLYQASSAKGMLEEEFNQAFDENNRYPMMIRTIGRTRKTGGRNVTVNMREKANDMSELIGLPILSEVCFRNMITATAKSTTVHDGMLNEQKLALSSLSDLDEHCTILSGRMYSDKVTEDGFYEAIISQSVMVEFDLIIGEELEFESVRDKDGNPLHVRIVGVFTNSEDEDLYWYKSPVNYVKDLMLDPGLYEESFLYDGANKKYQIDEEWTLIPDYYAIATEDVDRIIDFTESFVRDNDSLYSEVETSDYVSILKNFRTKNKQISVMLTILEIPVILLLLAFIFMISRQMLGMEEGEIALLRSRGASGFHIFKLYLIQSLILSGVAYVIGIPLGTLITKLLGASDAFLSFSGSKGISLLFTSEMFLYGIAAVVLSMIMTLLPVFKKDKTSIVAVKRKRNRQEKPLWMKLYLDIICLGVSLYGYYSFVNSQDEILARVLSGKSLDVLLFLSAALFILGMGLLTVRLHRSIMKLIYKAGRKRWKPAQYTSFLQLIRTGNKQAFVMVFLVLTVSFGLFYTTIARTIVANAEVNTEYSVGSDIRMTEYWMKDTRRHSESSGDKAVAYYEPDFSKFSQIEGVSAARVYLNNSSAVVLDSKRYNTKVMAINTKEFGQVASVDNKFMEYNYYDYLNVLSKNSDAVLLSSNYRDKLKIKLGDTITVSVGSPGGNSAMKAVVYGFFDYWPTYAPTTITIAGDESTQVTDNYLVVANLSKIQSICGVMPYEVWLDMDGDTDVFYDFVNEKEINVTSVTDKTDAVSAIHEDPLFVGTNGILTMSFITILIVCSIGYLIYWSLSIKSRELQFGIFRAMGMTHKEIVRMLANEQAFTGLYCIVAGLLTGLLASYLFVPIIQIAYSAADRVLPMELITETGDVVRLVAIILLVFAVCLFVLIRQVFAMKISQALKLGED